MNYKNILITGGAGFVGSNICVKLKEHFGNITVFALDNLYRKGSERNLPRLKEHGVKFIKGDVRKEKDLDVGKVDLLIECSAEPSVLAGVNSSSRYAVDTNLSGAVNCFEIARKKRADVVFLSTSRVYPVNYLNSLVYRETKTRFELTQTQTITGASAKGISEKFPLDGVRSLYGATKLSAEIMLFEYADMYAIRAIVNRFGVIAGPWQFGKVDQGILSFWLSSHMEKLPLSYIGFGGEGKQVRDILHIDDLFDLLLRELKTPDTFNGKIVNAGGGFQNSVSLVELTLLCQKITGNTIPIRKVLQTRKNDVPIYITDNTLVGNISKWKPTKTIHEVIDDTYSWLRIGK